MTNEFIGPSAVAIGIANGLILTKLITTLRDKGVITREETLAIFSDALAAIDPEATRISEREAAVLIQKLVDSV